MYKIAIIGGTGPQGKGLGYRFAKAGHDVILGSRSDLRAVDSAGQLNERLGRRAVRGARNSEAATDAELVLLAVPYEGHDDLVEELAPQLAGKTVISCVNPLGFDKTGPYGLDIATSAAEMAQASLPASDVVGAFHHLSAVTLMSDCDALHHEDVLVCGDSPTAKQTVIDLALAVTGKPGIDVGALRLARQLEPLTAVLISVNKKYKVRSGIALVGLEHG